MSHKTWIEDHYLKLVDVIKHFNYEHCRDFYFEDIQVCNKVIYMSIISGTIMRYIKTLYYDDPITDAYTIFPIGIYIYLSKTN